MRTANSRWSETIVFQGKNVGIVYIRSDLGALYSRLKSYAIILFSILAASMIAALALSRLLQRVVSKPILNLADTAGLVSRNKDYSVRARSTGDHDEVALMVEAFNGMLLEIQKRDSALQESERQFRTLADSIPQMAWMGGPDGSLDLVQPALVPIHGNFSRANGRLGLAIGS